MKDKDTWILVGAITFLVLASVGYANFKDIKNFNFNDLLNAKSYPATDKPNQLNTDQIIPIIKPTPQP